MSALYESEVWPKDIRYHQIFPNFLDRMAWSNPKKYGLSVQSSSEYMMSLGIIVINHSALGYEPHLHGNPPAKCSTFTTIYFRILLSRVKSLKGSRNRVHLRYFNDHQVGTGKYMLTLYFFEIWYPIIYPMIFHHCIPSCFILSQTFGWFLEEHLRDPWGAGRSLNAPHLPRLPRSMVYFMKNPP